MLAWGCKCPPRRKSERQERLPPAQKASKAACQALHLLRSLPRMRSKGRCQQAGTGAGGVPILHVEMTCGPCSHCLLLKQYRACLRTVNAKALKSCGVAFVPAPDTEDLRTSSPPHRREAEKASSGWESKGSRWNGWGSSAICQRKITSTF